MKRAYQKYVAERLDPRHDFLRSPYSYARLGFKWLVDGNVRRMRQRLHGLEGKYKGKRCFLVGNGPSLNQMELDWFKDEYMWCSNRFYLMFDRIAWRPSFYSSVDVRVTPDIAEDLGLLVRELKSCLFFIPVLFSLNEYLESARNLYWYREKPMRENSGSDGMFTADASCHVYAVRSVTIAALQLAVYMGFNPVYLIGCDTSYKVPDSVREESGDNEKLVSTQDDDLNHFDYAYFGKGRKWHQPHPGKMIDHYRHAKKACDEMGVAVYNATVGGKLEVFQRVDYRDIVR